MIEQRAKVLCLHQPWATLVALGEKSIETRSWKTSHRGPIVIHCTKNKEYLDDAVENEVMRGIFLDREYLLHANGWYFWNEAKPLVFGAIIATGTIDDSKMMGTNYLRDFSIASQEFVLGNWSPERYQWRLKDVRPLDEPIPYRGSQGLQWLDLDQLSEAHTQAIARSLSLG